MKKSIIFVLILSLLAGVLTVAVSAEWKTDLMNYSWHDPNTGDEIGKADATDFEDGWNDIISKCNEGYEVCVKFNYTWLAEKGKFGDDDGPGFDNNTLYIPKNAVINIDLGGNTIERGLGYNEGDGEVIYIGSGAFVSIANGTISGGFSDNGGGGIHIKDANVRLDYVTFDDCNVYCDDGAAIHLDGGSLQINKCTFNDCCFTSDNCYGTIYVKDGKNVVIHDSTFNITKSRKAQRGSAIYATNCEYLEVKDCSFTEASSNTEGGTFFLDDVKNAVFTNLIFKDAFSEYGGAAYINCSTASFNSCTFDGNESRYFGGAVYTYDSDVTFNDCIFKNNFGKGQGGAVYSDVLEVGRSGAEVRFANCEFTNNSSEGDGGAIYVNGGSVATTFMTIDDSTFTGNVSGDQGGAIYLEKDNYLTLNSCTITGNTSKKQGGGIYTESSSSGDFEPTRFLDISGNTVIKDNIGTDSRIDNLYICLITNVKFSDITSEDSTIGLRHPGGDKTVAYLSGKNNIGAFFSDNPEWAVSTGTSDEGATLLLGTPITRLASLFSGGSLAIIIALVVILVAAACVICVVVRKNSAKKAKEAN